MKRNTQVQPIIADDFSSVTFNIADGGEPLILHMERLSDAVSRRAACTGMAQVRIVDAAAIGREDDDGNIRTDEEMMRLKRDAIARLIAHYETGTEEWGVRRATGAGSGRSLTIEAIARIKGMGYEDALEMVDRNAAEKGMGRKPYLAKLASGAQVSAMMDTIRAERRGPAKVDADDLLNEMK